MLAVPHRHTHRGPFSPEPLPAGLLPRVQHDAIAEGASLVLVDQRSQGRLRDLVEAAARWQERNPVIGDELREWTGARGSDTRDGVPPSAYPARTGGQPDTPARRDGVLTRRDFDQGRGEGQLETGGPPSVTAILVTAGDTPAHWLRAGQALNRVLVHAASVWVFAALNSQPMESPHCGRWCGPGSSCPALRRCCSSSAGRTPPRPPRAGPSENCSSNPCPGPGPASRLTGTAWRRPRPARRPRRPAPPGSRTSARPPPPARRPASASGPGRPGPAGSR